MKYSLLIALFLTSITMSCSQSALPSKKQTQKTNQPDELGTVDWIRNFENGLALSEKENKPVFLLFQEVPGCATCRNYGHNVLSNPLMTEAIENEFIPLAIFNNKGGKDREVLKIYKEPTWNNPVVRIVDYDGVDIVDRVGNDYSAQGLYKAMEKALKANKNTVPEYMKVLGKELYGSTNSRTKETYYSMYCFWTGEKSLGSQTGILNTEAGFMNGHEVVKVTYDAKETDLKTLNNYASNNEMRPMKEDSSYRASSKDEDYYLKNSNYKFLPLSELQRTLINSALGKGKNPQVYLSPRQKKWLSKTRSMKKILFKEPFDKAWNVLAANS